MFRIDCVGWDVAGLFGLFVWLVVSLFFPFFRSLTPFNLKEFSRDANIFIIIYVFYYHTCNRLERLETR